MKNNTFFERVLEKIKHFWQKFWNWLKIKWHRYQINRWIIVLLLSAFLVISIYLVALAKTTDVKGLRSQLKQATIIYDQKDQKAGYLYSQKGTWVNLDQISPNVENAVLSVEDRNFYHEHGFSVKGITRAGLSYVKNKLLRRNQISGGGSTLTQQLVKNAFLSQEQTFTRKAKEIFISVQVENVYSKKDILAMYLNNAYFGNGVWGVEDASEKYFGKHASQLTVPEAATLAGMLKGPNVYNPIDHPKAALARRNVVLKTMVANDKITEKQKEQYQKATMNLKDDYKYHSGYRYPYYFDAVIAEAMHKYDLTETQIMNQGYKIYTSLNQSYQESMQQTFDNNSLFPATEAGKKPLQAASIAINPKNGDRKSVV